MKEEIRHCYKISSNEIVVSLNLEQGSRNIFNTSMLQSCAVAFTFFMIIYILPVLSFLMRLLLVSGALLKSNLFNATLNPL